MENQSLNINTHVRLTEGILIKKPIIMHAILKFNIMSRPEIGTYKITIISQVKNIIEIGNAY